MDDIVTKLIRKHRTKLPVQHCPRGWNTDSFHQFGEVHQGTVLSQAPAQVYRHTQ